MNASASLSPPTRHAPLALWRVAEAFMHTLCALFGNPEDVAADHTLTKKPYLLLLSWIRCAEAMLRRLLLIEAATYATVPGSLPSRRQTPRKPRQRKLMEFSADKPEEWRVSFRCFSSPVHGGSVSARSAMTKGAGAHHPLSQASPDSSAARGGANRFFSAWPIAERYEALVRAFNNPEPYARRLAARLQAAAHRIKDIFRAPPEAEHRIDDWEALTHAAEVRWKAAADTT
jgi:hypothetical protein